MHDFEKLEKMLEKHLEELTEQGKIASAGSLDTIHKITDTMKNIKKIEMLCGEGEGEYSQRYMRADGPSYRRGYMRDGGYAYEDGSYRGGYSGTRRDSMGRYTRHDNHDHIISRVGEMMSVAETEEERKALEKCLRELQG